MVDLKSVLRTTNLIYLALIFMLVSFMLIVYVINESGGIDSKVDDELSLILRYILFAALPTGLAAGYFLFKHSLSRVAAQPLNEKLKVYQQAILIRCACFEFPGLLGGVSALLTADSSFLLFTALIVVLFFLYRPTAASFTTDLNLSPQERIQLESSTKV